MRTPLRKLLRQRDRAKQRALTANRFRLVERSGTWFWGLHFYGSITMPKRTKKPRPTWRGTRYEVADEKGVTIGTL